MTLQEDFVKYMRESFPQIEPSDALWEFAELLYFGGAIEASQMSALELEECLRSYHADLAARVHVGNLSATVH